MGDPFTDRITVPQYLEISDHQWQGQVGRTGGDLQAYASGLLLAAAYATSFHDLHSGNVVRTISGLCVVDGECMFSSARRAIRGSGRTDLLAKIYADGMEGICILPMRIGGDRDAPGANWALLGGSEDDLSALPVDTVAFGEQGLPALRQRTVNLPKVVEDDRRRTQSILDAYPEFARGFRDGIAVIRDHGSEIVDLAKDQRYASRVVLRPTQIYFEILRRSYHPSLLRSTADRSAYILGQLRQLDPMSAYGSIYDEELSYLLDGMIPSFELAPTEAGVREVQLERASNVVSRRIDRLQKGDEKRLAECIRLSFLAYPGLLVPDGLVELPAALVAVAP